MSRKMTVVFHDEELYADLKAEAARRHMAASDIVAKAVQRWLDEKESEELLPLHQKALAEYEQKGGRPWEEVDRELEEEIDKRRKQSERTKLPIVSEKKNVYT